MNCSRVRALGSHACARMFGKRACRGPLYGLTTQRTSCQGVPESRPSLVPDFEASEVRGWSQPCAVDTYSLKSKNALRTLGHCY